MSFEKQLDALTNGNPIKPTNEYEKNLAKYWYGVGEFGRNGELKAQNLTLRRLILLTHEAMEDTEMNELTSGQWAAFLKDFPLEPR